MSVRDHLLVDGGLLGGGRPGYHPPIENISFSDPDNIQLHGKDKRVKEDSIEWYEMSRAVPYPPESFTRPKVLPP